MSKIEDILVEGNNRGASDIHLCPRSPVMFRIDGELVPMSEELIKAYEIEEIVKPMLTEEQTEELEKMGELDFAYSIAGFNRVRVNVFRQRGTYAMALRILSFEVPSPKELGVPEAVVNLTTKKRGLVLVTGATGSGKSTTLASLIGTIAKNYKKTIITLEDPIEYLHRHGKSMVLQREIGYDSMSYANAVRAALRQDPDVILVGEMRDLETISIAITAAETGHLVFSTLHTNSAASAVDRMIDVFPPHQQQQIRIQLASVLEGIIAQQLLP
ncbi:MAG: type IV pilus twitching motility protein PilT, partial [Lachnospiraceae bacterium]